ncbi:MAG: hypothetical protein IT165_00520 [Bryobacterales bacterium]|nr:hypothetical protein [Bryobacterales bacterium]
MAAFAFARFPPIRVPATEAISAIEQDGIRLELQTERKGRIDTGQISFERVKQVRDLDQKSYGHSLGKDS